ELHMGVRSGVTRAEQMLKTKLKNNRQVKRMWKKMEKMHPFYAIHAWPLFLTPFLALTSGATRAK
ncbi:MAG: hypothetical protein KJO21_05810, partial [Verrucomicrobiae bacterium]|nr:hypothetical protein [Verrucomicrobiae bacterium]